METIKVNTKEVPNSHIGDQQKPLYGYELYAFYNDTTNTINTNINKAKFAKQFIYIELIKIKKIKFHK